MQTVRSEEYGNERVCRCCRNCGMERRRLWVGVSLNAFKIKDILVSRDSCSVEIDSFVDRCYHNMI